MPALCTRVAMAPQTSIKRRLMLVILLTSLTVLSMTWAAFVIYEMEVSRQDLERNVKMTGQILADQATSSLMSKSKSDAREVLSSLRFVPHIEAAALYDTEGNLFAFYPTNASISQFPPSPPAYQMRSDGSKLQWTEPVAQFGKTAGSLCLESNLDPVYDRLHLYVLIGALVTAGSFLVALFLSSYLQKGISRPILQLAETARIISNRRDYTVRARKSANDELGVLTDAFNHMLEQIHAQEGALRESADRLRLALQASQTGTWDWHIEGNRVNWDESMHRQFGLEPGCFEGTFEAFLRAIHLEDRPAVNEAIRKALEQHRDLNIEFRVLWPDGSLHFLVNRGQAIYDEQGHAVRMAGASIDISDRKRAEEGHALVAAIVESSDDAIIGKDLQGRIISWNAGAERVFGYAAAEVLGQSVTILTAPDRPDEEERILMRIRAGSAVEHYETTRMRKDGRPVQISLSASPIRNRQGQVVGVSSISRDITERKQAEAVLAHQAGVLREQAQMLDLANVLARDKEDRIILWSAGMEQLYGWSRGEAIGQVSHQLLATECSQPLEEIRAQLLRDGQWTGELTHRRRDGERLTVASRWVVHQDQAGQLTATLEVNNDVTARKLAEEEIRRLNAELEERVKERTAELTEANRELEAFTYSVSHDLRAPLRHIDAFTRIIEEELSAEASATLRGYIGRIRKGTQTMGRLVDDLLNLSRVGRAQLGLQRVDLNSVVEDTVAEFKGETGQREIEWRISPLPAVQCDPGLIRQVFANLLSNAVKYSRPRAKAVIEVGQAPAAAEHTIYVRDNGAGFDMKYVDKLFGVFERLHRPDEFEGTGIGLATVRRIVQKHGGRVWAEAEPDQGATFYFTLPEAPVPNPTPATAPASPPNPQSL
jgi:PAS domain S-box-containing protein